LRKCDLAEAVYKIKMRYIQRHGYGG
jgi:hypothetical protein